MVDHSSKVIAVYDGRAGGTRNTINYARWADSIEEIKTVCWCGKRAIYNARFYNGKVVKTGAQIQLSGNESYVALCRRHWAEGRLS